MALDLSSVLNFLGSKAGQTTAGLAGSGLSAYGQYQQNKSNQQNSNAQFLASLAQGDYNAQNQLNLNRAAAAASADPLGADQAFAQKNALRAAILPGLRNPKSAPGDAQVAAAMGNRTGIQAVPEGGFDPMMVNSMFGPQATASSIAQRHNEINNIDPNAPTGASTLSSLYGSQADPAVAQVQQWASAAQNADAQTKAAYEAKINTLAQKMLAQEQDTGGFWHKFAKIAGIVGGVAATALTGGAASPLLGVALGAGSGALGAWGSGSSPLAGAIMGGGMSALGGAFKPSVPSGTLLNSTMVNE